MGNLLPSANDDNLRDDIARIREAISKSWNITSETKAFILNQVKEILQDKSISTKDKISAMRLIVEINKVDLDAYKTLKNEKIDDDKQTEIIVE